MTKLFIHIAGIDNNLSREDRVSFLQNMFAGIYEITEENIQLINDKKYGGYRNFMFAVIDTEENANKIIEALNGTTYENHEIAINVAQPMEPRDNSSRGGYSNGGSRGGYNGGSRGGYSSDRGNGGYRGGNSYGSNDRGYRAE